MQRCTRSQKSTPHSSASYRRNDRVRAGWPSRMEPSSNVWPLCFLRPPFGSGEPRCLHRNPRANENVLGHVVQLFPSLGDVQRFDPSSNTWQTVVDASGEWFCRPVPLSMINTQLVSRTLAPGASVEIMNGEATGARDAFRQGDLARFVVFTKLDKSGDWTTAIASVPFVIEDNVVRDDATPFRVKH